MMPAETHGRPGSQRGGLATRASSGDPESMADHEIDPRRAVEGTRRSSGRRSRTTVTALGLVLGLVVSGLAASPAAAAGRQVGEAVPAVGRPLAQRAAATLSLRSSADVVRKN